MEGGNDGHGRTMWMEIMKAFNCKAFSTLLSCGDRKSKAFTHNAWGKHENASQLGYILGQRMCAGTSYRHNKGKLCST